MKTVLHMENYKSNNSLTNKEDTNGKFGRIDDTLLDDISADRYNTVITTLNST